MANFKKSSKTSTEVPTAALPDIIFMLLFFFMVTTVLREQSPIVEQKLPEATQLDKIEDKTLVSYIYIGEPTDENKEKYGSEPAVQVNDVIIDVSELIRFVNEERDDLDEAKRDQIFMSLKADENIRMGILADVQQELRKANARKILYASRKRAE